MALVHEQFRAAAVFLYREVRGADSREERSPIGTGFWLLIEEGDQKFSYLVTARHVIQAARAAGSLLIRVNVTGKGDHYVASDPDDWVEHPRTDVAALLCSIRSGVDVRHIPLDMFATNRKLEENLVGEGDEVFMVGLFSETPGVERAQPIIRFGNISLMPREKVQVQLDPGSDVRSYIDAYLVEARSWGGQSGSPVFVTFPAGRAKGSVAMGSRGLANTVLLLGLVHGHYEIGQPVAFQGDVLGSGEVSVNAGIAVVVVGTDIEELLQSEEVVEARKSGKADQV